MVVISIGMISAVPAACTTRATSSTQNAGAKVAMTLPTAKSTTAMMYSARPGIRAMR